MAVDVAVPETGELEASVETEAPSLAAWATVETPTDTDVERAAISAARVVVRSSLRRELERLETCDRALFSRAPHGYAAVSRHVVAPTLDGEVLLFQPASTDEMKPKATRRTRGSLDRVPATQSVPTERLRTPESEGNPPIDRQADGIPSLTPGGIGAS